MPSPSVAFCLRQLHRCPCTLPLLPLPLFPSTCRDFLALPLPTTISSLIYASRQNHSTRYLFSHAYLITMSSLRKLVPATAIAVAAMALPAAATTTMTRSPMYADDGVNMIPVMMVVGVSIVLALVYTLWRLLPRIRSGELSSSKLGSKWRAELLNQTPKKKARFEDDCSSADMV
ncbi:hypothetical protein (pseudogene) [Leishmania infantum JPCM5]|uniref:Transmembrane protein n=2 Tax=Leishmania infantum TaxID=5671 RepID=A4IAD1_LEIIN|nr:hypothetical protein (pseudogene) [Leishmania infantum JPCM5]CAM71788.1 hypothetical protein (pseudogene) [Leishmania infantum JPCM5]|eukprot:XP_001468700.1 hypothetical protein (pseudogene) [Leishmania infantum JPCM5]